MTKIPDSKTIFDKAREQERQAENFAKAKKALKTLYRYDIFKLGFTVVPNTYISSFSRFRAAPVKTYNSAEYEDAPPLSASNFFVIVYLLAKYTLAKTPTIAISQQLMEEETGLSRSTIRRSLQTLEKFGYIERLKKRRPVKTGFIRQFNINVLIALNKQIAGEKFFEKTKKAKEENKKVVDLEGQSLIDLFEMDVLEDQEDE